MKALLGEMKQRYRDRYIIIDTPPILPYAETHALSAMVDGIVFIVKEGMASIKGIRDAIDMLNGTAILASSTMTSAGKPSTTDTITTTPIRRKRRRKARDQKTCTKNFFSSRKAV